MAITLPLRNPRPSRAPRIVHTEFYRLCSSAKCISSRLKGVMGRYRASRRGQRQVGRLELLVASYLCYSSIIRNGIFKGSTAVTTIEMESHSISYHTMATMVKWKVPCWRLKCFPSILWVSLLQSLLLHILFFHPSTLFDYSSPIPTFSIHAFSCIVHEVIRWIRTLTYILYIISSKYILLTATLGQRFHFIWQCENQHNGFNRHPEAPWSNLYILEPQ